MDPIVLKHGFEPDPSKPQLPPVAAWKVGDHEISYANTYNNRGMPHHQFFIHHADQSDNTLLGQMNMHQDGTIGSIETNPNHLRKGIATKLFNTVSELSSQYGNLPAPKHSTTRTKQGAKWAEATGGEHVTPNISKSQFHPRRSW